MKNLLNYISALIQRQTVYIGHLLPILMLRRFQQNGHVPIALVGGGTGMIGDPSFKDAERSLNTLDTVKAWSESIKGQLSRFIDFEDEKIQRF